MVGIETGGLYLGKEKPPPPTAGGYPQESFVLWAIARRKHLKKLRGDALGLECHRILAAKIDDAKRRQELLSLARETESRLKRELVNLRYSYSGSVIEAARTFQNRKFSANGAIRSLIDQPLKLNGDVTVSCIVQEKGKASVVVEKGDKEIGRVSEAQFVKHWWSKAKKHPPTP